MQNTVPISRIDIIVYPFFLGGYEHAKTNNARKVRLWIKLMKAALEKRDTAFIAIHYSDTDLTEVHSKAKPLLKRFSSVALELKKRNLFWSSEFSSWNTACEALNHFSKIGFAKEVLIRGYGQHQDACVEPVAWGTAKYMAEVLHARHGVVSKYALPSGLSIKHPELHVLRITNSSVSLEKARRLASRIGKKKLNPFRLRRLRKPI